MPLPDLNPILRAADKLQGQMDTSYTGIIAANTSKQKIAEADASLELDIGVNNATIKSAQSNAALATQNARLKAGAIFGADLNQQGEVLTSATQEWMSAVDQRIAAAKAIQAKQSVNFLDNPLGYILNQFSVNDDIRAHNAAVDTENAAKAKIDGINAMSNATAVNQANFTQSITQASIDAEAKNISNVAQKAANKARIEALGYNSEALTTAINMDKDKLNTLFNVQSSKNAQEQLRIALGTYDLHKAEFGLRQKEFGMREKEFGMRQQEFNWKQEERALGAAADDMMVSRMQKGFEVMYGSNAPDLSAGGGKLAKQYLTLLKSNTPAGREAAEAYLAGQSGVIAGTPANMIEILKTPVGAGIAFTPQQVPIKKLFDEAITEVTTMPVQNQPKNKQEAEALVNSVVTNKVNEMLKKIEPGSKSNLFNIGAIPAIIQMPGVAEQPLVQKVLAPAITAGAKFDDPNQVYAATMAAVKKGTISLEAAVDGYTTLYQKGVETNLATRNLPKFGIVPTENMRTYRTEIDVAAPSTLNPFGSSTVVDNTNKNDVKRAMSKTLASEMMLNIKLF